MSRARPSREQKGGAGNSSVGGAAPQKRRGGGGPRGGAPPPPHSDEEGSDDGFDSLGVPMDSVVKVFCVHSRPNFSLPWQRKRQVRSTGSGFCINLERRAILTNAHCIEWHSQVKVQRRGTDTKFVAKVLSVGWECDCAVLTVEEDEFWDGMKCVQLSPKIPHLEDAVLCVGFPVGGDTISVSSGVISRIEVMVYAQACTELLGIQIDAAINDGNSGGPAFNQFGECVGMAFQSMMADKAENVGYIIPTVVITHFLNDLLKHGKYTGFPMLGVDIQTMENPDLRDSLGMATKQKGVLVSRVAPTSAPAKVLKPNDVLLSFDRQPISNDGTVLFRKHERVAFSWIVAQKFYGESAQMSVLRDGKVEELQIEDFHSEHSLVPVHLHERKSNAGPSYFIVAGLVFTSLSVPFLRSEFGEEWDCEAPVELVHRVVNQRSKAPGEELVVLTQLLANELTIGYEELENVLLETVNGTAVRNLRHLMELVDGLESEYLTLGLDMNLMLVLNTEAAKKATASVLEEHSIPAAMSQDLRPPGADALIAPAKKAKDDAGSDSGNE